MESRSEPPVSRPPKRFFVTCFITNALFEDFAKATANTQRLRLSHRATLIAVLRQGLQFKCMS
jgi:hypothetical protein